MSYPGDTNLSAAIQERVQNTYAQSRELALKGKTQEASLGCEFVLRLDPLFEPARELAQQLESGGPISEAEGKPAESAAADPDFDLATELESLLDVRDFRTLLSVAKDHATRVAADSALAEMVTAAEQRLEAEPYVRSFIESAEKAQRQGRQDEALALLEKARSLDPSHPSLPAAAYQPEHDESNDRIRELLDEGQRALDRGDHQGAIDSWSRIFLIDIDHGEATRRIENARRLKAENERKIEEAFHEGVSLWEIGTTDKAREQFERVLRLDSSHPGARDYLERMDARAALDSPPLAGATPSGDAEIFSPPDPGGAPKPAPDAGFEDAELPDLEELGAAPAKRRPKEAGQPKKKGSGLLGSRRFLLVGGVVVVLLVAAFAALYLKRETFFPNSDEPPIAAQPDALAMARKLQAAGQTAMAVARLKQLATDHPQYAEAQALIAQWEAPPPPEEPTGPSPEDLAKRDALVGLAQQARQGQEYLRASTYYARAAQLAPLDEEDQLLQAEVDQRLAGLETEIELFRQGDWEFVLPGLWKLHAANPDDRDVTRLMVDSYFNLGVRDLQRGDTKQAAEKFTRAAELDPEDAEVARLLRFSEVYGTRPSDLLYRIFVKYLRFR
jgi:tetratricopeptide (TPR) repeat protein